MKKTIITAAVFGVLVFLSVAVFAEAGKTTVGGHVKMVIYDSAAGSRSWFDKAAKQELSAEGGQYTGMSFKEFTLYITHEISDVLTFEVQPKFEVSTGATPSFGTNIGNQVKSSSVSVPEFGGWEKAFFKWYMPLSLELSAGIMLPVFTMEYGHELFWEDMLNASKFVCGSRLAVWHDTGLELYAPLTLGEDISFPLYLYLLNGNSNYVDYNSSPSAIVHIEPQWGILTVSSSFGWGKADSGGNTFTRWAAGASIKSGDIEIRCEYAGGRWELLKKTGPILEDGWAEGYLLKILYRPVKWLRLMYHHESAYSDTSASTKERDITNTPGFQIFLSDTTILMFQLDVADWVKYGLIKPGLNGPEGYERMVFTRPTLGIRSTF